MSRSSGGSSRTCTEPSSEQGTEFHEKANRRKSARQPKPAHAPAGAQSSSRARASARELHERLLAWYAATRRDLPWRRTRDPYAIWLSEVMLQQTRVETVIPYYERFMARFPTVHALADAPVGDVLSMWSGLGYYRRARMLHAAAQQVASELGGAFPASAEGLVQIKGIGRYTAGAVASIAFDAPAALVDGNVARVFARIFAIEDDVRATAGLARVWALADALVPARDPGAWNQALMELGATVCVPREPRCLVGPVHAQCEGRARGLERDLPRLKPKAKPLLQRRFAVVASRGDAVLLGRRRADLRFGGMWEPPSFDRAGDREADDAAIARFEAMLGARITGAERGGEITHVLSHRRMEFVVLKGALARAPAAARTAEEYDAFELVDRAALGVPASRALSTLARKLLAKG
jgi:A/G-specific adenine glycosylase